MTQNMSHAVMAQRVEPATSLDDFPTPPWATRALVEHVLDPFETAVLRPGDQRVWEPACGRGHMGRALNEYFQEVVMSDIHDYGAGHAKLDFLSGKVVNTSRVDWIITNPPFRLAEAFILRAFELNVPNVAMLVRTGFLESVGRYERIFQNRPPALVAHFTERVPMVRSRYDPYASTATAYCWLIWNRRRRLARTLWIPPCRRELERERDKWI